MKRGSWSLAFRGDGHAAAQARGLFGCACLLGTQGLHVLGGEAYIQFKPEMIDGEASVPDETVRGFLKAFVDRFIDFAGRLAPARKQAAA